MCIRDRPYTVRIWINPTEGNTFADLDDVTVTVNGSTDGVTFTHNALYTLSLIHIYTPCAEDSPPYSRVYG